MRRNLTLFLTAALAASLGAAPPPQISAARYRADVKRLASPEMKGRGTGSPELEKAARYIQKEFRKAGLGPVAGKGWLQRFEVVTDASLGKNNRLAVTSQGQRTELKPDSDFMPMNFSARGKLSGALVFAGYGITAPQQKYDDFAGIDVKDKIVIVLRSEPQEKDPKSVFNGDKPTTFSNFDTKASTARVRGAKAVLFVDNNLNDAKLVPKFNRRVNPTDPEFPFVQVKAELVDQWLAPAGRNLKQVMAEIDRDLKPQSLELAGLTVEMELDVVRHKKVVPNVVGWLPGETAEYIILGAHFDHLGLGGFSSMGTEAERGKAIHHGADDNASGTAGLLELARYYGSQPRRKRGMLFLAFAGEEMGLLGSSYFTRAPWLPLERATAMVNMDMIGRIKDGKAFVGGAGTGSSLKKLLEELKVNYKLTLDFSDDTGYGASDHQSFYIARVPVLFFFSGLHADYHKPSDTWDKINAESAAELLRLVAAISDRLTAEPERPQYVRMAPPQPAAAPGSASALRGYGPSLGTIPDFGQVPDGFRIADVRPGGPAEKAGLRGGDIMMEFDGKPIKSLMDFTVALREKKPGDEVVVKVRRSAEVLVLKAILGTSGR